MSQTANSDPARAAAANVSPARLLLALERRPTLVVAALAALVLLGGVAYSLVLGDRVRFADERDYLVLSQSLADGDGYALHGDEPTAYHAPGYPMLLAVVRLLGSQAVGFRALNFVLLALTILVVYALARRVGGPRAGLIAAALCAVYPFFFYTAGTLYPQPLATLLLATGVLLAVQAHEEEATRRALARAGGSGLALGALVLSVPTFAPSLVIVALWLGLARRPDARRSLRAGLAVALLAAGLVLPGAWTVRNAVVLDAFVPVASNGGANLLLGNNENATAGSGVRADVSRYVHEASQRELGEVEINRYYAEAAIDWIKANPGDAAKLYVAKVAHHFDFRTGDLATREQASAARNVIAGIAYVPLLALLLARLVMARRSPPTRSETLMILLYLANAFVMAIWLTRLRYRLPLDALLIVVAANTLVMLLARLRARVPRALSGAASGT